jgi:Zn-dependent protease with chaperone function
VAPLFAGSSGLLFLYEIGLLAFSFGSLSVLSCRFEKQADLDAAKTLGTAIPLIELFKTVLEHQLKLRNETWQINEDGDLWLDILHPSLKERIRYLEEFESAYTSQKEVVS